jgi:hypothetical protein
MEHPKAEPPDPHVIRFPTEMVYHFEIEPIIVESSPQISSGEPPEGSTTIHLGIAPALNYICHDAPVLWNNTARLADWLVTATDAG